MNLLPSALMAMTRRMPSRSFFFSMAARYSATWRGSGQSEQGERSHRMIRQLTGEPARPKAPWWGLVS